MEAADASRMLLHVYKPAWNYIPERPNHGWGSQLHICHHGVLYLMPCQSVWDLWWTHCHWGSSLSVYFCFLLCIIFIHVTNAMWSYGLSVIKLHTSKKIKSSCLLAHILYLLFRFKCFRLLIILLLSCLYLLLISTDWNGWFMYTKIWMLWCINHTSQYYYCISV